MDKINSTKFVAEPKEVEVEVSTTEDSEEDLITEEMQISTEITKVSTGTCKEMECLRITKLSNANFSNKVSKIIVKISFQVVNAETVKTAHSHMVIMN